MLKKQMRACYKCEHCSSDERCNVAGVLECYYNPTQFGHQLAERPKMRKFKQRKEQEVFIADFLHKSEENIVCLSCGATTAADVIICDICAKIREVALCAM